MRRRKLQRVNRCLVETTIKPEDYRLLHIRVRRMNDDDRRRLLTESCYWGTALHLAVYEGKPHIVRRLLEIGLDPNHRDYSGYTPLMIALVKEFKPVIELLIEHGAFLHSRERYKEFREYLTEDKRSYFDVSFMLSSNDAEFAALSELQALEVSLIGVTIQ